MGRRNRTHRTAHLTQRIAQYNRTLANLDEPATGPVDSRAFIRLLRYLDRERGEIFRLLGVKVGERR